MFKYCICLIAFHLDYDSPRVPLNDANKWFKSCCQKPGSGIPRKCHKLCNYGVTMRQAEDAIKSGACDTDVLQPFLRCANGDGWGSDNKQCCKDLGVMSSSTDTLCAQFCEKNPTLIDVGQQHMRCALRMSSIMKCHHYGLQW